MRVSEASWREARDSREADGSAPTVDGSAMPASSSASASTSAEAEVAWVAAANCPALHSARRHRT